MRPFVVDNQSYKRPKIKLAGSTIQMPRSRKNGHFGTNLIVPQSELPQDTKGLTTLSYHALNEKNRNFEGTVHLVPPSGVSVISDIDDTIKITNYLNKKEFLKNTFLLEFQAVPGMAELFQQWKSEYENCCFHFVSASPYQLYEELDAFCRREGFPPATFHLKTIRPKDKTILQVFADPVEYKRQHIERILKKFPTRTFLLVGDSGEKDPEIYSGIYNEYPNQVEGIWIRNINNATADRMKGVPSEKWQFFGNGTELLK
jgi:phosphatidate phosphatase APP1